jgi:hypothetical protein
MSQVAAVWRKVCGVTLPGRRASLTALVIIVLTCRKRLFTRLGAIPFGNPSNILTLTLPHLIVAAYRENDRASVMQL